MDSDVITTALSEVGKWIGGGAGGVIVGYVAQKKAAKSEAVLEVQSLKDSYREFAEFTKKELELSKKERKECQNENDTFRDEINSLKLDVNKLTMAMHNAIGTPKDKQKPLNKG
jgi:hypothetical protein